MHHPHDYVEELPDRPPIEAIRSLSRVENVRALRAIAAEWVLIAGAIAVCQAYWHPLLYVAALVFIGARQHALLVIGHDASHYTMLQPRWLNDAVAELFIFWPGFLSTSVFRHFHRDHHRYLDTPKDGNRQLWRTHTAEGDLTAEWIYPKSGAALLRLIAMKMIGVKGLLWIVKGVLSMFAKPEFRDNSWWFVLARSAYYAAIAAAIWRFDLGTEFLLYWVLPFCTWHIASEHMRLVCEHSAVPHTAAPYHLTRTTVPRTWERWMILPRHIGYHHEHHWYPSVPFYRLPELHTLLATTTSFAQYGHTTHGVIQALRECTAPRSSPGPAAV
jgi:fatty acid desaturase